MADASTTQEGAEREPAVFNPFDPAFRADPYPTFRRLQSEYPLHQTPLGFWVLTRHADCTAVLKDHHRFSSDGSSVSDQPRDVGDGFEPQARPFLFMDPPDHTRLRGLVSKAFTARVVERLEPRVREIVDELLDDALVKPEMELIGELAYPLPVRVITELLGVPAADHEMFKEWSAALARGLDPEFVLTDDEVRRRNAGITAFREYFTGLIEDRRRSPGEDLLSGLVAAEDGGETLSEAELLSTCILLLVAGHETTVNLIGNGALALLRNRDQLEILGRDPTLWRGAVEELLRYDPPVQLTGRTTREEVDLHGVTVGAAQFVIIMLAAANRDPSVFEDPDRLDVRRADTRHLSFGFGTHFCLGAPLARLEARVALATLTTRAPELELAVTEPAYKENLVLRGLESLQLGLGRAR